VHDGIGRLWPEAPDHVPHPAASSCHVSAHSDCSRGVPNPLRCVTVIDRRERACLSDGGSHAALLCFAVPCAWSNQSLKVLRIAFPIAEDGFDPARINDTYSHSVVISICESLYTLRLPGDTAQIRPLTAAAMPEHSPDYRTWTIRLRPGIYFTPDPAFKGQRRELVAADYVYSFKRFADPTTNSPQWRTSRS